MKYYLPILLTLLSLESFASIYCEVSINELASELQELNLVTVPDTEIVTQDDLKYCPDAKLKNQNITPEELPDDGSVWRVGNRRWNDDWEKRYQKWISDNPDIDLFSRLGIETDCADAVIYKRAIFSRMHNLPFSVNGMLFGQHNRNWAKVPQEKIIWNPENWKEDMLADKRFVVAMQEWGDKTGTVNFPQDTYPVKIFNDDFSGPAECVASGLIYHTTGHAEMLIKLNPDQTKVTPYRLSGSSSPKGMRNLDERLFAFEAPDGLDDALKKDKNPNTGLLHWNWTINCGGKFKKVQDTDMPYYSLEQYEHDWDNKKPSFANLNEYQFDSLKLGDKEREELVQKEVEILIDNIESNITARKSEVDEALEICKKDNITGVESCYATTARMKDPMEGILDHYQIDDYGRFIPLNELKDTDHSEPTWGHERVNTFNMYKSPFKPKSKAKEAFYYEYSSPNRDGRLARKWRDIEKLQKKLKDKGEKNNLELMNRFIDIGEGKKISYYHFLQAVASGTASPQPWDKSEKRWGEEHLKDRQKNINFMIKLYAGSSSLSVEELLSGENQDLPEDKLRRIKALQEKHNFMLKEKKLIDEYFAQDK